MAFESLKAEIALLFETMADQPHDRHELYLQVKEKINQYRAFGMPLPDDYVALEAVLDEEFRHQGESAMPHETVILKQ